MAEMISVEIKYNTFKKVSHQTTLFTPTCGSDAIYQTACELLAELWDGTPIRLLGIRSSKLSSQEEPVQLSLFDLPVPSQPDTARRQLSSENISSKKREQLDAALDSIRKRYGADAVTRGSLMNKKDTISNKKS